MTAPTVEVPATMPTPHDLATLLVRSATGDHDAFMAFYDATCNAAYRLARCTLGDADAAEQAVLQLYVAAWRRAGEHAGSGLSPGAWLLALPSG